MNTIENTIKEFEEKIADSSIFTKKHRTKKAIEFIHSNTYTGLDHATHTAAAHILTGIDDELAKYYTIKAIETIDSTQQIRSLPNVLQLQNMPETIVENILRSFDKLVPKESFPTTIKNDLDTVYSEYLRFGRLDISFLEVDTKTAVKNGLQQKHHIEAKLEFIKNNPYKGNNISTLVDISKTLYEISDIVKSVSAMFVIGRSKNIDNAVKIMGTVKEFADTSKGYAQRAIDIGNVQAFQDITFCLKTKEGQELVEYILEKNRTDVNNLQKILNIAKKAGLTYTNHRKGLDFILQTDPNNMMYVQNIAAMELEFFLENRTKSGAEAHFNISRAHYKKVFDTTKDIDRIPEIIREHVSAEYAQKVHAERERQEQARKEQYRAYGFGGMPNFEEFFKDDPFLRDFFGRFARAQQEQARAGNSGNRQQQYRSSQPQRTGKSAYFSSVEEAYTFLQVKPGSPLQEVKTSYRKLSMQYHPDKNDGKGNEEMQKKLNDAWDIVKQRYA